MSKTTLKFILHVLISYFVSNSTIWEPEVSLWIPVSDGDETQNLDIGVTYSSG